MDSSTKTENPAALPAKQACHGDLRTGLRSTLHVERMQHAAGVTDHRIGPAEQPDTSLPDYAFNKTATTTTIVVRC